MWMWIVTRCAMWGLEVSATAHETHGGMRHAAFILSSKIIKQAAPGLALSARARDIAFCVHFH
jgi:hypothetical protein